MVYNRTIVFGDSFVIQESDLVGMTKKGISEFKKTLSSIVNSITLSIKKSIKTTTEKIENFKPDNKDVMDEKVDVPNVEKISDLEYEVITTGKKAIEAILSEETKLTSESVNGEIGSRLDKYDDNPYVHAFNQSIAKFNSHISDRTYNTIGTREENIRLIKRANIRRKDVYNMVNNTYVRVGNTKYLEDKSSHTIVKIVDNMNSVINNVNKIYNQATTILLI